MYWSGKYKQQNMGWDVGSITTPIKAYIDQLNDKSIKILVPGCGKGYEVKYLHDRGFNNVKVIDLSPEPFKYLIPQCSNWKRDAFIIGDFFDHEGMYDLILEQTFFCSLKPIFRQAYADKMNRLLFPKGKLVGVLFNINLGIDNPPFGGSKEDYIEFFNQGFKANVFDTCYNSIKPRSGAELFINLSKITELGN